MKNVQPEPQHNQLYTIWAHGWTEEGLDFQDLVLVKPSHIFVLDLKWSLVYNQKTQFLRNNPKNSTYEGLWHTQKETASNSLSGPLSCFSLELLVFDINPMSLIYNQQILSRHLIRGKSCGGGILPERGRGNIPVTVITIMVTCY